MPPFPSMEPEWNYPYSSNRYLYEQSRKMEYMKQAAYEQYQYDQNRYFNDMDRMNYYQ